MSKNQKTFDFKHFKKTGEDKHTTELTHKDGHKLSIRHTALGPDMRSQLAALPMPQPEQPQAPAPAPNTPPAYAGSQEEDQQPANMDNGGTVQQSPTPKQNASDMSKGFTTPSNGAISQFFGNVKDSVVGKANGGEIGSPDQMRNEEQSRVVASFGSKNRAAATVPMTKDEASKRYDQATGPTQYARGGQIKHYADGTPDGGASNYPQAPGVMPPDQDQSPTDQQQQQQMPLDTQQQPPSPGAPPEPPAPGTTPDQDQDTNGMQKYGDYYGDSVNNSLGGIANEAQALGKQGKMEAAAAGESAQAQQDVKDMFTKEIAHNFNEYGNFISDYKNDHIDPNHYLNTMGTGQKIATGIGLILGGAGSGVTGQSNGALDFLNKQIDRDIEGQKMQLGRSTNLLSANLHHYGNISDAMQATRLQQQGILADKLRQAAAMTQDPLAKARGEQAAGTLERDSIAPGYMKFGAQQAYMKALGGGPISEDHYAAAVQQMQNIDPNKSKDLASKLVPGVGYSRTQPIDPNVRQSLIDKQTYQSELQRLYGFAKDHTGSLSPKDWATGRAMSAEVGQLYKKATGGGQSADELHFIQSIIPDDPTSFSNSVNTLPKLKAMMQGNQIKTKALMDGHGIVPFAQPADAAQAAPRQQQTQAPGAAAPAQPTATPQTKWVNGVEYFRDANGKAQPVKK